MLVLALWAGRLQAGDPNLVPHLQCLFASHPLVPLLPAVILRNGRGSGDCPNHHWVLGHSPLRLAEPDLSGKAASDLSSLCPLVLEDVPGSAASLHPQLESPYCTSVPAHTFIQQPGSTKDGEAGSGESIAALVAAGGGGWGGGGVGLVDPSGTSDIVLSGKDMAGGEAAMTFVRRALEPPPSAAVQRLLRELGVGILSQQVKRRISLGGVTDEGAEVGGTSDRWTGRDAHHACCCRARAVFPLVQRFLMQV